MRNALIRLFVCATTCFAVFPLLSFGQALPVPEYFGIYAVVDGHLLKLDTKQVRALKLTTVRMGQRAAPGNVLDNRPATLPPKRIQVPRLPTDLKIVIYAQTSGMVSPQMIAESLRLESLVFVRALTVDTGWPRSVRRTDPENGWDAGDPVALADIAKMGEPLRQLEFLVKPMPNQKDMVIAGLAEKLTPGLYRLSIGQTSGSFLFAVEPISQGEIDKCVDASTTYAMMMSRTKYRKCVSVRPTPS